MKLVVAPTLVLGLLFVAALPAFSQKTTVIVNRASKLDQITAADLRAVFTGSDTHLPGNVHLTPVLQRSGATQDAFLKTYIGKADMAFRSGWRSLVFSGQATMPATLDDDDAVIDFVAKTPGAIGYVSKAPQHEGVVILTVR